MAEIRCPMCSQPNPEDAEVCGSCQARLKPLIADSGPVEVARDLSEEPSPIADVGEPQGSDWLSRMRSGATSPADAQDEQAEELTADSTPDWLGRLRDTQVQESDQQVEQEADSDLMAEPESSFEPQAATDEQAGQVPDWLARIRQRETEESAAIPETPEPSDIDGFSRLEKQEEPPFEGADISARLMGQMDAQDFDANLESESPILDIPTVPWDEPIEEADGRGEISSSTDEESPAAVDFPDESEPLESDVSEVELPWLASTETQPESVSAEEEAVDTYDAGESVEYSEDLEFEWPEVKESSEPSEMPWETEPEAEALTEEAEFEWLEPGEPSEASQALEKQEPTITESEVDSAKTAEERIFGINIGLDLDIPDVAEPVSPTAVESPASSPLILDEDRPIADSSDVDLNLDDIDLPDWLADMKEPQAAPAPGEVVDDAALAPATLPTWLEAMRPVDSFRSVMDMESADSQAVESAGPLAGLRGVLMAEPVVAMPRAATIGSAGLEVTERQFAQAELLQHILVEEEREHPPIQPAKLQMPVLRWVISIILVLTVMMPTFLPSVFFGAFPKSPVPQEFIQFLTVIENVSTETPALVVFDYPPGYNGELSTIAGPFLEHLMLRGVPVATLSTSPTGPSLAEAILSKYGENWTNYIHLGYLSGGPTAVQVFAAAPRNAVPRGFKIPIELHDSQVQEEILREIQKQNGIVDSVWQSKLLENVDMLSDFSMVTIITASPENARTWAEQAPDRMEDKPLVMILSTGAEPLVRPYYESTEPQIQGILTGMPAAVAYELRNAGQTNAAEATWDAFGFGMLAVQLILVVGGMYGIGVRLWRLGLRGARGKVDD